MPDREREAARPAGADEAGGRDRRNEQKHWEARHAKARQILDDHCASADDLVNLGIFPSRSAATRFLTKEHERKQLSFFGRYRMRGTKPRYHYSNADLDLKLDNKAHEIILSWVIFLYWVRATCVLRGSKVDQALLPDATICFGELVYHLEIDTGEMSQTRMKERFDCYKGCEDSVLVVTTRREKRLENLRATAKEIGEMAFFTTLDRLLADKKKGYGEVWTGGDDGELYDLQTEPDAQDEAEAEQGKAQE